MDATAPSTGIGTKLEPKRLVGLAFLGFALAGGMFLGQVTAAVLQGFRVNDTLLFGIDILPMSTAIGFAIALSVVLFCYFNPRIHMGSLDVAAELKRVTWPSLGETRVSTVAVIVASVVAAVVLFAFDFISSKVMTEWMPQLMTWMAKV